MHPQSVTDWTVCIQLPVVMASVSPAKNSCYSLFLHTLIPHAALHPHTVLLFSPLCLSLCLCCNSPNAAHLYRLPLFFHFSLSLLLSFYLLNLLHSFHNVPFCSLKLFWLTSVNLSGPASTGTKQEHSSSQDMFENTYKFSVINVAKDG